MILNIKLKRLIIELKRLKKSMMNDIKECYWKNSIYRKYFYYRALLFLIIGSFLSASFCMSMLSYLGFVFNIQLSVMIPIGILLTAITGIVINNLQEENKIIKQYKNLYEEILSKSLVLTRYTMLDLQKRYPGLYNYQINIVASHHVSSEHLDSMAFSYASELMKLVLLFDNDEINVLYKNISTTHNNGSIKEYIRFLYKVGYKLRYKEKTLKCFLNIEEGHISNTVI